MNYYLMEMWYASPTRDMGHVDVFFAYDGLDLKRFSGEVEYEFENAYESDNGIEFLILRMEKLSKIKCQDIPTESLRSITTLKSGFIKYLEK